MPNGPAQHSMPSLSQQERDQIKKQDALKMQMICLITLISIIWTYHVLQAAGKASCPARGAKNKI